jgi:hypothetical protein
VATGRIGVTPTLRTRWSKQPTAGTTSLSGLDDNSVALVYDVGYEAVYRNGTLLSRGNDYTATDGTTVTLIDATLAGDIIEILANQLVPLTDAISKGQFNAKGALLSATAASTPGVLAVGTDGQVLTADSTASTGLKWGSSGLTWTQRLAGTGTQFNQIAYNGTNLYVAVGNAGQLYSSPDGKTWTSRTSGFGANNIRDVAFGNGLWVAVGINGTITTSTDGTTWTARTSNMSTNALYQVVYANSLWVVVGNGGGATNTGGIAYSSDGITWTRKSQTLTVGATYQSVVWNGTNWIVGSSLSTNNYLYATTPSGTWTAAVTTANTAAVIALYYDGTRTIWSENSLPYYTTASTLTSEVQYNNLLSSDFKSFKYYNSNLYYFAGMGLQVYTGTSSAYPAISAIILTPTTFASNAGSIWTTNFAGAFVGAAGYIIADSVGRIYTSF